MEPEAATDFQHRLTYSIADARRATGLSDDTIRRAIQNGELPALRPGTGKQGKIVVLRKSLLAWLERLEGRGV